MVALPAVAQVPNADSERQWQSLNAQVMEAYREGDYRNGIVLAEQGLRLARQTFDERNPRTLISLSNLALLYKAQGRYGEAEPLYLEALRAQREELGPHHPDTLTSLNNLAILYHAQGRYGEAEPMHREVLQGRRQVLGPRHPQTLVTLSNLALLYKAQGRYGEAEPLSQEALQAQREVLGPRHPDTLLSLNNLGGIYYAQGRYGEAEPRYLEALQGRREVLGPRHPQTLGTLNNLALLYQAQGRYGEAEPLSQEALQAQREVLGARHPDTLRSLNNWALLRQAQGRYGDAEPLFWEALQARREVLGPRNPDTLTSLHSLAALYQAQGRYSEAERRHLEALQARREVLGPHHSDTLTSLNDLAILYHAQGRYDEAEPMYREVLHASREALGPHHPNTLGSLNNLAVLYQDQGRYGEAEPLALEVLQASREVLGPRNRDTLISLNNLAFLYRSQGRYGEAEPLLREALQASREMLGPRHPLTLGTQLDMARLLATQNRRTEAVRMLQQMEPHLLSWIGQELYSTAAGDVRRLLVSSQATFQDTALNLATLEPSRDAGRLAGSVLLRFKLLQSEEEAYLARLTRRSQDPRVRALADEVGKLRAALVRAAKASPSTFEKALQALEAKQQALGTISRDYKDHLRVMTASLDDVRAVLPASAVLIEFRQFRPIDFRNGQVGDPHLAALLLAGSDDPIVADLGPISELQPRQTMLDDQTAATLYERLFAPFEQRLAAAKTVYVTPDGFLNLVAFAQLKLADGRYWGERQEVRLVQSGRDLLRADPDKPARGLLALGGIDFGAAPTKAATSDGAVIPVILFAPPSNSSSPIKRIAGVIKGGFAQLPASRDEASEIKEWYQRLRKDERAEVWSGADASKSQLMALKWSPRVLHLATHGFYVANDSPEPMLNAGVALAGANRELEGNGADGILFALEAQGLNLEGSELVVLSACDTAQGGLDYSEGVYGLVRALRTAGARNVLVTLWKLNDGEARDFMVAFYKNWLSQVRSDPAKALRDTQLSYLKHDKLRDPRVWAPYILIE
jgi:CHAT domain-containing protein/tetratricopeptide (TPR) repeat protein